MSRFLEVSNEIMEIVPGLEIGMPIPEALELILAELKRLKALAGETTK